MANRLRRTTTLLNPALASVAVHALGLVFLLVFLHRRPLPLLPSSHPSSPIQVELDPQPARFSAQGPRAGTHDPGGRAQHRPLDLRPDFVRDGMLAVQPSVPPQSFESQDPAISSARRSVGDNPHARELLYTETRLADAFDALAARVSYRLSYPDLIVEAHREGYATLELFFDARGEVDETKSRFQGSARAFRGLLAFAAREGLKDWYLNDVKRLRREELRNQRFRADFQISYGNLPAREVQKLTSGSYRLIQRGYGSEASNAACLSAGPQGAPAMDLYCVGRRFAGLVKRETSASYRAKLQALYDRLDHWDEKGLYGVNEAIRALRS